MIGCRVHALDVNDYLLFEVDVYGTKQRLRIEESGEKVSIWKRSAHSQFTGYYGLKYDRVLRGSLGDGMPNLLQTAVKSLRSGDKRTCNAEHAFLALKIAQSLKKSCELKKRIAV